MKAIEQVIKVLQSHRLGITGTCVTSAGDGACGWNSSRRKRADWQEQHDRHVADLIARTFTTGAGE